MFFILRFVRKIFCINLVVLVEENFVCDLQEAEDEHLNQFNILKVYNKNYSRRLADKRDNPNKPREIFHYVYFKRNKDIGKFAEDLRKKEFAVIAKLSPSTKDSEIGYKLMRIDKTDATSISEFTTILWKLASKNNGHYRTWETIPVTEELS